MKRPYLWITLAVLAVYGQVLFFNYTYLDDYTLIVQNSEPFAHPGNLLHVFTRDFIAPVSGGEYYRPLLVASLIFNGIIAGQAPFFYHLTDVLIHLGVALLLYKFLFRVTGLESSALFGSLAFAVHPLLLQTVAWIPARNDSLAALFILWYVLALDQALKNPSEKKPYGLAALAMALALASKEIAIIIPLISGCYVWLVSKEDGKYKTLRRFIPIWIVLLGVWLAGRSVALAEASIINLQTIFSSVYFSFPAVISYLGKMLFPFDLSTYPTVSDLRLTFGLIALAVLGFVVLLSKQKRSRVAGFGAIWFLSFLVLSLVRVNLQPFAEILEHRAYLPFIGVLILVLELDWFKTDWLKSTYRLVFGFAVLAVLALGNLTHAASFRNGLAYWQQAARTSPGSPFAHRQLGAMRHKAGDIAGAEAEYKTVIAINPEGTDVYNNLGLLYYEVHRYNEAEMLFRKEISVNPNFDKAYMNLGNLYWDTSRKVAAEAAWKKTVALNPYFFQAYRNLAIYYYEKDQYAAGLEILREIVKRGGQADADILEAYKPYMTPEQLGK